MKKKNWLAITDTNNWQNSTDKSKFYKMSQSEARRDGGRGGERHGLSIYCKSLIEFS